jgi:hypothetical protein
MSKLNPKFEYTTLSRQSVYGKRLYSLPDGGKVPSVTTILSQTMPPEKRQMLADWKKKVGEEQAQLITTQSSSRGTRMHAYLETYIKTGEIKDQVTNPYAQEGLVMAKTVIANADDKISEFWGSEVSLFYPGLYAGTADSLGVHEGKSAVFDFKQSNKPKKREWIDDYFLQLASYIMAHDEVYGTKIERGVILMCTPDLIFQEFVVEGDELEEYKIKWCSRVEQYFNIG